MTQQEHGNGELIATIDGREIRAWKATFTKIPQADIDRAIRQCYSQCDRHACPYLATYWSEYFPAAFTGAPTRTRLCDIHVNT